jgi:RimJ/RimL family protein N-acetyltransferase
MIGRWCRVEPIDVDGHAADLFEANSADREGRNWTYLSAPPPPDLDTYRSWLMPFLGDDPMLHAIIDVKSGKAVGVAAYLRIDPANGVIEVGHINYAPSLQRTPAATEAMYLMMRRVFDELGYRRYEWKCDALNAPSRKAATRLGFQLMGIDPFVIPANSYTFQSEPVPTVSLGALLVVNKAMSEKDAYNLAKAVVDNIDQIQGVHASMKALTPQFLAQQSLLPYHPGAEKVFRERGLKIGS